jgi:hypothetical protein
MFPRLTNPPSTRIPRAGAPHIKNGTILFQRTGCQELLGKMSNFGVESHYELNDALAYLLQGLLNQRLVLPKIHWIEA